MEALLAGFEQHGLTFVGVNVLLQQLGLPIPAVPTMIVAGALAAMGRISLPAVFAISVLASVVADLAWYFAGRRYGYPVLKFLCRVSLSPDTCVRQTEGIFERWGFYSLVVSKFVPGFSTVAPPIAGALKMSAGKFLLAALALYIAYRAWQRWQLARFVHAARISVDELHERLQGEMKPMVVDIGSKLAQQSRPHIPGAKLMDLDDVARHATAFPTDREIVFYCNCPNEESAKRAAQILLAKGYTQVRPLSGGIDAWVAAGRAVEHGIPATFIRKPVGAD